MVACLLTLEISTACNRQEPAVGASKDALSAAPARSDEDAPNKDATSPAPRLDASTQRPAKSDSTVDAPALVEAPAAGGAALDSPAPSTGETGAAPTPPEVVTPTDDPEAKIKALMREIGDTATPDDRTLLAAQEAVDLGASVGAVGRAVNRRAARLFKTPERATAMYEWSRTHYTNSAAATFELAKLACMSGDIDAAKALLNEVKTRGGDDLLQTVSFDPTFSLVVNDSDIQALLK
jgi:hypothetical protein